MCEIIVWYNKIGDSQRCESRSINSKWCCEIICEQDSSSGLVFGEDMIVNIVMEGCWI